MNLGFIVALVLAVPVILFPVAFLWYMNFGGVYQAIRQAWKGRVARRKAKAIADADCQQNSI